MDGMVATALPSLAILPVLDYVQTQSNWPEKGSLQTLPLALPAPASSPSPGIFYFHLGLDPSLV